MHKELNLFFQIFNKELRKGSLKSIEVIMMLSIAHLFKCYNPKEFADFIGIKHQILYSRLKKWSPYKLKRILLKFMVHHVKEAILSVGKSDASKSRACISFALDNSVLDRLGKKIRCTWNWYSGRCKKVVNGQDLLGIVINIHGITYPLHLLFCSKQGRACTDKPSLLIKMFSTLKDEFKKYGIEITDYPISMDSWFVSEKLINELNALGFHKIIIAGKGNYVFEFDGKKQKASEWKKEILLEVANWGIDVPSKRVKATNPTFKDIVLFFFEKSKTKCYYLIDFSTKKMRGAEIWNIWNRHHSIENFWKVLKSVLKIKEMRLHGDGLYSSLLIKLISYLILMRLSRTREFFGLSFTQIIRTIQREYKLEEFVHLHFHSFVIVT